MAWYRCGGGGVPASLKNDMNVVLNKKFHSLDDYDPKEWPELTNLLGKLPEATVSGSIVTFSDGADDVPLKSCEVALSASLDGYSSVTVHHTDGQTPPVFSEVYTASLGRTIYGGTADVVNGVGKDNFTSILISETSWTYDSVNARFISANLTGMKNVAIRTLHVMAYGYETIDDARPIGNVPDQAIYNANYERKVIIHDSNYTNVSDFLTAKGNISIIYPLATPTDFTFEPIEINSRLGANTMWSDGDIEVTYRRDIDLALGGQ